MTNTYFFTGYPGFIARSMISEVIDKHALGIGHMYILVLPAMKKVAEESLNQIVRQSPLSRNHFTIVEGDITKENLGLTLPQSHNLQQEITHVYHLAAIYDLAVKKRKAETVNIIGTHHVNQWVENIPGLKRYTYFSTAYVSGEREGTILETELRRGQAFKNHYERTKYEAEGFVEETLKKVPTTIIRPGIVRGHSETGETTKFDGPYFYLNLLERMRQMKMPVIPYFGRESNAEGNFVPVDYVIKAAVYLSHADVGEGKTYHLTDPDPYKMHEVFRMLSEEYLGKTPKGSFSGKMSKSPLMKPLEKFLGIEKEALAYGASHTKYDCWQAQHDLEGSGITCPSFKETLPAMVEYYRKHREDRQKHVGWKS
ncbi:thioester reductase-like protein [Geomicrobium halophilum]|uniref:Thioester reductase-like protein n=1 Tax=Geomicrobium halophilum TaxID=549000 RepID=A0A841PRD4_9BACL|nr:SDR family oxidoreductase [Geomicrobium halophilum]MBB6451350.1 thioester reductase-like protein [Geomicrobium halophilum]